jgi:UDP-glucose:(heptosyl)LPS alpha-1,3-glucosyltransferase
METGRLMRVGLVIDELDPRRGGMAQWCWQFVEAVAKLGYELHVVSQGFGCEAMPSSVICHTVPRTKSRVAFADAAAEIVRSLELDVVHDTGTGWQFDILQPHGGSHAGWLRRRLDMYPSWVRALKRPLDALLPRHRDFDRHWRRQYSVSWKPGKIFVALSEMVADDFVCLHRIRPEQIEIVYNGVDCRRFSPAHRARDREIVRRQHGISEESLVLLLAAHNFRLKGVPELLRVAGRLVANGGPIHVAIAGGKRVKNWQQAANRLGLEKRVTFFGTVTDMVPYYAAADAYVHPTYYDPCSLVLLEAAASGLPIVTTRSHNGAAELFRKGHEILTVNDPRDAAGLYECVESLFDERVRSRLGAAARRVALRHPFERNVAEILALYERFADRRLAA